MEAMDEIKHANKLNTSIYNTNSFGQGKYKNNRSFN